MDSLMCCMANRRYRRYSNPLEGRVNLRLQGRQDYEDMPPPDSLDCKAGSSSPSSRRDCDKDQMEAKPPHFNGGNGSSSSFKGTGGYASEKKQPENKAKFQSASSDSSQEAGDSGIAVIAQATSREEASGQVAAIAKSSMAAPKDNPAPRNDPKAGSDEDSGKAKPSNNPPKDTPKDKPAAGNDSKAEPSSKKKPSVDQGAQRILERQLEDLAKNLRKQIQKYPSSGKSFFGGGLKKRFFALSELNAKPGANADPISLCYWEDEESCQSEECLGSVPIVDITAIEWNADQEKGCRVKVVTNTKDKKDANLGLTLQFANSPEARSWSKDLQKFCDLLPQWSQNCGSAPATSSVVNPTPSEQTKTRSKGKK